MGAHAGVRRVVAVTGDKARQAFVAADTMAAQVAALEALEDPPEGDVNALKDALDRDDSLPAPSRAQLRTRVRPLQPFPRLLCVTDRPFVKST